jgi:hypothetical protein
VAFLDGKHIYQGDRNKKKARNGISLSDLCRPCGVASRR